MTITGKTTSAKIFTDNIEESALDWIKDLCDQPAMAGVPVVQMPDVHAGNNCNVGTAYPIGPYVNPDHVGVDIGCTISMHRLSANVMPEDFALLDHRIREAIPTGNEICTKNSLNEKSIINILRKQWNQTTITRGRNNTALSYAGVLCKAGVEQTTAQAFIEELIPTLPKGEVTRAVKYAYCHNIFGSNHRRYIKNKGH